MKCFFGLYLHFKENNARTSKSPTPDTITTENNRQAAGDSTNQPTSEPSANSFIDDIKNAAHQAQNDTGFIYEPTSGLYYDSRTGYYYNAVMVFLKQKFLSQNLQWEFRFVEIGAWTVL